MRSVLFGALLAGCGSQPATTALDRMSEQERLAAELRGQVAEAQSQIDSLRAKLAASQAEEAKQGALADSLKSQIAEQEKTLARLNTDLLALQSRLAQVQGRNKELEKLTQREGGIPFKHAGLYYDAGQVARVKANAKVEPWASALSALKERADSYLTLEPRPIRGRWDLPSPNDDPDLQDAMVKPLEDSSNAVLALAQYYLFTGDQAYAAKAVSVANSWTGSLMDLSTTQAVYEAGWELMVMAMGAEMLVEYRGWRAEDRSAFLSWLRERTWHAVSRMADANNHKYWLAAQAAAVGVVAEDPGLWNLATEVYKQSIAYDLAGDGHLPMETSRGELGMFYQSYALSPLVTIAEVARQQGIDLWGFQRDGKNIKQAIDYLFSFFDRPEAWPWSRKKQDIAFVDPALKGSKTGWFEIAYYHYKDPEIAEYILEERPIFSRRAGGMTTLTHGLPVP